MHDPLATLNLLLEQASGQRDAAIAALQRADAAARRARAQADDLALYRGQYQARWCGRFQQGTEAPIIDCHERFGSRLGQAVEQQQASAAQAEGVAQAARQELVRREQRVALIGALIERRRVEIARAQARIEQRDADETAQRLALHPSSQAAPGAFA